MTKKPNNPELDKAEKQLDEFEQNIKDLTLDRITELPKEVEPQTKLSSKEIEKQKGIYLKPKNTIADRQKFNEEFKDDWNFAKEYVCFIAEHKELIGSTIEMWTHPFGGVGAEYWEIPTNKVVWAPRYVAEQIRKCNYHRLVMQDNRTVGSDSMGQYYGTIVADSVVSRLTAEPVSARKSIFMGATSF